MEAAGCRPGALEIADGYLAARHELVWVWIDWVDMHLNGSNTLANGQLWVPSVPTKHSVD